MYQSNGHTSERREKHEPGGRKNQEFVMGGGFNRPTNSGNSRGFIFTVYILVWIFLSSLPGRKIKIGVTGAVIAAQKIKRIEDIMKKEKRQP